jgi:hypothetical protein
MIEYLCVKSIDHGQAVEHYINFQASMNWVSCINWILNLIFDIIIIKMYSVYQIFLCRDRFEANKVIKRVAKIINFFIFFYGILGFLLNLLSYVYLKQIKMKENGANFYENSSIKDWVLTGSISFLGIMLFMFDMAMLIFFIKALKSIIKHYSKDYEINLCFVTSIIILICVTYIIEMAWSDLCMWGSILNFLGFFQDLRTLNSEKGPEYYT